MLQIGSFSNLTGISIHMLRHYDKIGLLKPAYINPDNQYRHYSEKQLVQANTIQVLKDLGLSLHEIADIISADTLHGNITAIIQNKIQEKQAQADDILRQLAQMHHALHELDTDNEYAFSVNIKTFPACQTVSCRDTLGAFHEEGILWNRLQNACLENGIQISDAPYCMAKTHHFDLQKQQYDTEVFRVIHQAKPGIPGLIFTSIPQTTAAVATFQGAYSRIAEIRRYVNRWIEQNQYEATGNAFLVYYLTPENETDPRNYITDYCCPITKRS